MTNGWFLGARRAVHSLCRASLLACAALLCLLTTALSARAQVTISTDTTINYAINDDVLVTGSPTVALVSGGSIAGFLIL